MPYRICKTFEIENGHMLAKHPDNCRFPHGHSRRVEVVLEADQLDGNEMVCDFKAVKDAAKDYIMSFDHSLCMNTKDPKFAEMKAAYGDRIIAFEGADPTTEVLAKRFFDEIRKRLALYAGKPDARYPLGSGVRVVRVRVWETSTSWAEYED